MSAALKEYFSHAFVDELACSLLAVESGWDREAFRREALAGWTGLELKQRMRRLSTLLGRHLPGPYPRQLECLLAVEGRFNGLPHLVFPDFVQVHGLEHWEESLGALARFTKGCSSEFAIRPFLEMDLTRGMRHMLAWSAHEDPHLRRLSSEGCRPRLPWAPPLRALRRDPRPALPVLDRLRDDPSDYVRKSVANHLNDICKDHPDVAKAWAGKHMGESERTDRVIKHGLRTLIKGADPETLPLLGYAPIRDVAPVSLDLHRCKVDARHPLRFSARLRRESGEAFGLVRVDAVIQYRKANGSLSPKVFHLVDRVVGEPFFTVEGRRDFRDLSTRRHHAGEHRMEIRVNGLPVASASFEFER